MSLDLVVVTATTSPTKAASCFASWGDVPKVIVWNGIGEQLPEHHWGDKTAVLQYKDYLGSVPAFRIGVDMVLDKLRWAGIIACLHDDLEIQDPQWVSRVQRHFERYPRCGLAGFGGAIGLGSDDLYKKPYDPMQLARIGFRSNLADAEVHGARSHFAERVACLDGFSQIGHRKFFLGEPGPEARAKRVCSQDRPWTYFEQHGIVHHLYDSLLGAYAARLEWETWYLPIACRHFGGRTAVGDQGYAEWAKAKIPGGDHGFWIQSHKRGYELFKDVLPLRV